MCILKLTREKIEERALKAIGTFSEKRASEQKAPKRWPEKAPEH